MRGSTADGRVETVLISAARGPRPGPPDGVRFFEVDHPATQADKRMRAPRGGPAYVPAILGRDDLPVALQAGGFDVVASTLVTLEGLTMYLEEDEVSGMLTTLAGIGGPGSRLAVNFGVGFDRRRRERPGVAARVGRAVPARRQEPIRFELSAADAPAFLAGTGWRVDEVLTGPDLGARHLAGTDLSIHDLNPAAFAVSATRS